MICKAEDAWTQKDQEGALKEGWGLFSVTRDEKDEVHWEIQRYDEDEHERFKTDEEAVTQLVAFASNGAGWKKRLKAILLHNVSLERKVFIPDFCR